MALFNRVNKKITLAEIENKETEVHDKKMQDIQADAEKKRIEYEAKFNKFRQDTINPRRIDYKAYGGMETW